MILFLIFTVGCNKSTEKEETNPPVQENESISTVQQLDLSYEEGKLSEKDYHSNKVSLLVDSNLLDDSFSYQTNASENIDLAYDIQWMIYHYDELTPQQKQLLAELIEKGNVVDKSSYRIPFVKVAYAMGEDNSYPKEIAKNVYITGPLGVVDDVVAEYVENLYLDNFNIYLGYLGIESLDMPIVISLYPMVPGVDSTSFYATEELILDGGEPIFYIHLNSTASDDTLKGSFLHEYFHAHQFQMGYTRATNEEEFLMESTAIFAVAYADENIDYFHRFDEAIFNNPIIDVDTMNQMEIKSWYQLYYMTYYDLNNHDFMKDLLKFTWFPKTLYEKLLNAAGSEDKLHNIFAEFGDKLFKETPLISNIPYDGYTFDESIVEDISSLELENDNHEVVNKIELVEMGYYPKRVLLEDAEKAYVEIISNIGEIGKKTKTGLIIYYEKDGAWEKLLDGKFESLIAMLNLKKNPTEYLMFIPFNYDSEEPQDHEYSFNVQRRIEGEGFIDIHYSEESNPYLLTREYEKEYNITIVENIELLEQSGEGEIADYMKLITGDSYYVKDFQALFIGDVTDGNQEEDFTTTAYLGEYTYKDGDASFENTLLNFPMPDINNALSGLEGIFEGFEDLPGVDMDELPELPNLDEMIADEFGGDLAMDSLLPPIDSLYRFKDDMISNRFNFYPAIPPKMVSDDWIEATKTHSYIDSDGKRKTDISIESTQIIGEVFPLWFVNPFFDPVAAQNAMTGIPMDPNEFVENYSDTGEILEQIAAINGQFDKSNLALAINAGPFEFDMSEIESGATGILVQELKYANKKFTAYINAEYITEDGSIIKINIDFEYNFD